MSENSSTEKKTPKDTKAESVTEENVTLKKNVRIGEISHKAGAVVEVSAELAEEMKLKGIIQ